MNRFVFLFLFFASASPAFTQGVDALAIKKAKGIRDANNAQQGAVPAQPVAPGTAAPSTNAPRGIDPGQQANIDKLASDISDIKAGVRVSLDQRKQIHADALVLAKGAVKPFGQSLNPGLSWSLSTAAAASSRVR